MSPIQTVFCCLLSANRFSLIWKLWSICTGGKRSPNWVGLARCRSYKCRKEDEYRAACTANHAACSHHVTRSFRKRWEKLSDGSFGVYFFFFFVNFTWTVALEMCVEKRRTEPEVSLSSAHLSSEQDCLGRGGCEAVPEVRRKVCEFFCVCNPPSICSLQ